MSFFSTRTIKKVCREGFLRHPTPTVKGKSVIIDGGIDGDRVTTQFTSIRVVFYGSQYTFGQSTFFGHRLEFLKENRVYKLKQFVRLLVKFLLD